MTSRIVGGRPKNNWTSSKVRKLARLTTLGSFDVSTTHKIIGQIEDGFQPCLRDVYKQLAAIKPQKLASRRRSKLTPRSNRRKISMQMKPQVRQHSPSVQRSVDFMAMSSKELLASEVVEDSIFYNPLAHWDYFEDDEKCFVTPQQVLKSNSAANECNFMVSALEKSDGKITHSTSTAVHCNREARRKRLQGFVACSELSFVVSLLSSRWTKSCLHTRVLSATSDSEIFCEISMDMSSTPGTSAVTKDELKSKFIANLCYKYSYFQLEATSLRWRPCCGFNLNWNLDPNWQCATCGFSAALDLARSTGQWQGSAEDTGIGDDLSSADDLIQLAELVDNLTSDPFISECSSADDSLGVNSSATLELFEQMLQSVTSDHLMEDEQHRYNEKSLYKEGKLLTMLRPTDLLSTDRFGNTLLHHAAAARNFKSILTLLEAGVDVAALNTHGQTFLHLLEVRSRVLEYLEILRYLLQQPKPFPFHLRDHYGLTIAHQLLCSLESAESVYPEQMTEIYSLVGAQHLRDAEINETIGDTNLDFTARFASAEVEDWATGDADLAIEIDKNGDTCLLAILKSWPSYKTHWDKLLSLIDQLTTNRALKANVNAYDQDGKTALIIAAQRGMCCVVERLLVLGANPNATDFDRNSVLKNVQMTRDSAKRAEDPELYTAMLQCEKDLVLAGAVRHVDPLTEFETEISRVAKKETQKDMDRSYWKWRMKKRE